jgi:enoyl-CoA hydratase/carnithine racemase
MRHLGLLDRVVVDVDDLVEVARHHLRHLLQPVEVESLVRADKLVDGDGRKIADSNLGLTRVGFSEYDKKDRTRNFTDFVATKDRPN